MATITQYIELPTPNIKLDHCVIHVSDWARSNAFYGDVRGAEVAPRSSGWAYHFGREQLNLHGPGVVFAPAYAARRLWPMLRVGPGHQRRTGAPRMPPGDGRMWSE